MGRYWRLLYHFLFTLLLLWETPAFSTSTKTVIADGHYVMADGDTLANAEGKVLQRAQRNAVEEAGLYLESTFHDVEKELGGKSTQTSSLEIRTIAAADWIEIGGWLPPNCPYQLWHECARRRWAGPARRSAWIPGFLFR